MPNRPCFTPPAGGGFQAMGWKSEEKGDSKEGIQISSEGGKGEMGSQGEKGEGFRGSSEEWGVGRWDLLQRGLLRRGF